MADIDPKKYVWVWERNAFPYYFYIFVRLWLKNKYSRPNYTVMLHNRGAVNCYIDDKALKQSSQWMMSCLKNKPRYFKDWQNYIFKTGRDIHRLCDRLSKVDWRQISDAQLLKLFTAAFKTYVLHDENVATVRNFNRIGQGVLERQFALPTIATLLATDKKSFFTEEHENLLKIADKIRTHKLSRAATLVLLKVHAAKYFYLPCGYYQEAALTAKDFEKKLTVIIKSGENLKQFQAKAERNARERQALMKKLRLSAESKKIIAFGSACTYFKDFIRGNLNRLNYFNSLIFKEIGRRTGNDWTAIAGLIPTEVPAAFRKKQSLTPRGKMVLYSDKKGIHEIIGQDAIRTMKKFEKHFLATASREIKGTPANKGRVKGRVLVIHKASEVGNKKNYILVTTMTTPDLMPAIKKSLAIITDEGGLTCHAAIVARELGKPCIIGTKIATKILHNGDLVEVDADTGIIKNLEKI